jgi:hypothetical protein
MLGTEESVIAPQYPFLKRSPRPVGNIVLAPIRMFPFGAAIFTGVPQAGARRRHYSKHAQVLHALHEDLSDHFRAAFESPARHATPFDEEDLSRCSIELKNLGGWLALTRSVLAKPNPAPPTREALVETVTPAAEQLAKKLRIYGEVLLAKRIVRTLLADVITSLYVDRKNDPDASLVSVICFTMSTRESVNTMLKKDNELQELLIKQVPSNACLHFSFTYQFE